MITRTGWQYEYVDALCLTRALDLLEYWRREADAVIRAQKGSGRASGESLGYDAPVWREPTEAELEMQFNMLPRANPQQVGMDQNIGRMPPELRDMVNYAEEMKTKHGLN